MLIYSGMGVLGIIVPGAFGTGGYFLLPSRPGDRVARAAAPTTPAAGPESSV